MKRNVWTSPFGLAFIVGSLAALVAGYFTGAGLRGSETNMAVTNFNIAEGNLAETYPDENALIAANREPPAPVTAPPPAPVAQAAPPPSEPENTNSPPDEDSTPVVDRPRTRDRRASEPQPEDVPEDNPDGPR